MTKKISAMTDIHRTIYMFLQDNLPYRPELFSLSETASLREAGVIETTEVPELVAFLEAEFQIAIASSEIVAANLDSIKAIVGYVERKLATSAGPSQPLPRRHRGGRAERLADFAA
jgi:acyl carrier protein